MSASPVFWRYKLGFFGDPARVAVVVLARDGIDDAAEHYQSWRFGEWIHHGGSGVGDEEHVALVDGRPTADARAASNPKPSSKTSSSTICRVGYDTWCVATPGKIGEAQIQLTCIVLLSANFEDFFRTH